MGMLTRESKERYISILADGKFHETVAQNVPGAELRDYETSDGKKGSKWELVYTKLEAKLVEIRFQDGDFGQNLQLKFRDDENNEVVVSVGTASNFGEDIMKKLPQVDFTKNLKLIPFSFTDDKERNVRGVNLIQDEVKLKNLFKEPDEVDATGKLIKRGALLHGFPVPQGDTENYDKDDWKMYFIQIRKFLVNYTKEHVIPKLPQETGTPGYRGMDKVEYPRPEDLDINPDDIPF